MDRCHRGVPLDSSWPSMRGPERLHRLSPYFHRSLNIEIEFLSLGVWLNGLVEVCCDLTDVVTCG